ncbi:MAG: 16S rRNA (guanine(527)-N(7))-methyltransferase RsmG [Moorea sp. SIO2B7]|nr:16S rRNA (guanine(527)-N(7))-methyltransferase RsmG [Moorena sp. SIO2B7]
MVIQKDYISLPNLNEIWQKTLEWQPNEQQQQQFQQLYEEILAGNRQLNLTRITEVKDFWEKHLWDSLAGLVGLGLITEIETRQTKTVIDIGTGAGFPGIPLAIALPKWKVTLLDSTCKKITFLNILITQLGILNVKTLTGRAEQIGQEKYHREAYDIALVRAVGSPSVCAEYALPLLKLGGIAILYRGNWSDEDTNNLQPAVKQLGGEIKSIEKLTTPLSQSSRHCIYLHKLSPTHPKFPRAVGVPSQQPL